MKLSQSHLHKLFSIVDTGQCNKHTGFDFVSRDSTTLVVTVGDSWTWGDDIAPNASNEFRLANVYGSIIAAELKADWLNLGQPGSGNFWLANKVQEFCSIVPELEYTKIYLICTYTEVGRAIHTITDVDFFEFFKTSDVADLVEFCDQIVTQRILTLANDPRIVVKIGRNFIDHCDTGPHFIPTPWYQLIANQSSKSCRVVSPWAIEDIRCLAELVPQDKSNDFMSMIVDLADRALQRERLLKAAPDMKNYHPTAPSHKLWADYILKFV